MDPPRLECDEDDANQNNVESSAKQRGCPYSLNFELLASGSESEVSDNDSEEVKKLHAATMFYRKASKLERHGRVFDAVSYYRQAMQLVPDIEWKYYEKHNTKNTCKSLPPPSPTCTEPSASSIAKEAELNLKDTNLLQKFQNDLRKSNNGRLFLREGGPNVIYTQKMHISDLPTELIIHILSYVISSHVDMYSLEQCAATCKGFYVCCRDEHLWQKACHVVWKDNLGTLDKQPDNDLFSARALGKKVSAKVKTPYESWRHMFINRPCVLFDGCYIGKFKYVRLGENKFQSALNLQVVQYYRCIRFMPDGSCYLLTTADSPSKSVSRLQNTHHLDRAVERGQYELYADVLTIIVKNTNQECQDTMPEL